MRGRIHEGKHNAFTALCRAQTVAGARSPGLMSFMGGYRRIGRGDDYVLASTWESASAAAPVVTTEDGRPKVETNLREAATVDSIEQYELHPPVFRGILDAPGAVLRVVRATIKDGRRDDLYGWVETNERQLRTTRLLLGWAMADRLVDGRHEVIAISAWPSPLMIEAVADPGRTRTALFAAVEEFVTDIHVEQYQSLEVDLPQRFSDVASRRVLVARFLSEAAAHDARDALAEIAMSAQDAGISVARLASAAPEDMDSHVVVARVSHADWNVAERLIVDGNGQIIHAADERQNLSG